MVGSSRLLTCMQSRRNQCCCYRDLTFTKGFEFKTKSLTSVLETKSKTFRFDATVSLTCAPVCRTSLNLKIGRQIVRIQILWITRCGELRQIVYCHKISDIVLWLASALCAVTQPHAPCSCWSFPVLAAVT